MFRLLAAAVSIQHLESHSLCQGTISHFQWYVPSVTWTPFQASIHTIQATIMCCNAFYLFHHATLCWTISGHQKTRIDTLPKEGQPQKAIALMAGFSQGDVSKHFHGKLTGREKCSRKRCTSDRSDGSLHRIVKQSPFKILGELQWTEAEVSASRDGLQVLH